MNNSIVGVKSAMRSTVSKHEQLQKAKFVEKASDKTMRYADFLAYVENEIKQSKVMATFNYNFPCFKNDGNIVLTIVVIYNSSVTRRD